MDWNLSLYGLIGQQHRNFIPVFEKFFSQIKPATVVEVGTGQGGASLALNNILKGLNYEYSYTTFDVHNLGQFQQLRDDGIITRCCNLFTDDYNSLREGNFEEIKNIKALMKDINKVFVKKTEILKDQKKAIEKSVSKKS